MPAQNKTPNIKLNQWQANEYSKMADFNDDNLKIDTAIKNLQDTKLDKTDKAVDSDKLDGKDSTYFVNQDDLEDIQNGMSAFVGGVITPHVNNKSNPHGVSAKQIGAVLDGDRVGISLADIKNANFRHAYTRSLRPEEAIQIGLPNGWFHLNYIPHVDATGYGHQTAIGYYGEGTTYSRGSNGREWTDWKFSKSYPTNLKLATADNNIWSVERVNDITTNRGAFGLQIGRIDNVTAEAIGLGAGHYTIFETCISDHNYRCQQAYNWWDSGRMWTRHRYYNGEKKVIEWTPWLCYATVGEMTTKATKAEMQNHYIATGSYHADPNTTLLPFILSDHANRPPGGYCYIETKFWLNVGGNCTQTATSFASPPRHFQRLRYNGTWTPWVEFASLDEVKKSGVEAKTKLVSAINASAGQNLANMGHTFGDLSNLVRNNLINPPTRNEIKYDLPFDEDMPGSNTHKTFNWICPKGTSLVCLKIYLSGRYYTWEHKYEVAYHLFLNDNQNVPNFGIYDFSRRMDYYGDKYKKYVGNGIFYIPVKMGDRIKINTFNADGQIVIKW